MELTSMTQRRAVAAAIGAATVSLALFAGEPSGLLVAIAAICICVGWKAGLAAIVAGGLLSSVMFPSYGAEDGAVRLVAFVAAAFGLWLVVNIFRRMSFFDQAYQGAGPSIADIPGLGWSANPDGRLRFPNAAALEYVGVSAEEMREIMDADDFSWWLRFVHPEDVETSMAQWRHSLETGEPMIEEQRLRRFDGTYRWFRDTGVASRDERGRIVGWYGHTEDLSLIHI